MSNISECCILVRLLYIVFCVGIGLLYAATAQDPPCTCQGECGTDGIKSPDGRKMNVAYGKSANMSSIHPTGTGPACVAVNGRASTAMSSNNCIHSAGTENQAWWQVNLGASYTVESITIYRRNTQPSRMASIKVKVDSATCYDFPDSTYNIAEEIPVTCGQFLTGSTVTLQKKSGLSGDVRLINFCEVQVWVCINGTYGTNCSSDCGSCRNSDVCNKGNGACPDGCQPSFDPNYPVCKTPCTDGTYGENCTRTCGQCHGDGVCNKGNGTCPDGCQPGFDPSDIFCRQACADYTYGENCTSACGQCRGDGVCNKGNGTCPDGCQPGFHPNDPLCKQPCVNGTYGENCASDCGSCQNNDVCNKVNGACPDGCQPGFDPNDSVCKKPCVDGNYGENCAGTCGQCRGDGVCNKGNGTCPDGCQPGFDPNDLVCKQPCKKGTYGQNCTYTCGECYGDCSNVDGTCPGGCQPGFDPIDSTCQKPCANGTYGENCASTCGQCRGDGVCNKGNGTCPDGCQPGFDPSNLICKKQSGEDSAGLIAGATVGGILFIIAVILIIIFFLRYRRKNKDPSASSDNLTTFSSVRETNETNSSKGQPLSFEPVLKRKSTPSAKPTVTVSPVRASTPSARKIDIQDDASHVYSNIGNIATPPQPRTFESTGETSLTHAMVQPPESETMDPDLLEEDISLDDDDNVYQNTEDKKVYASFKATKPRLDTVQKYLVDRLASGQLAQEFATLENGDDSVLQEAGQLAVNWKKNRFASILPYDHNRVVLSDGYKANTATDFVNASYISGYHSPMKYIASQGPRDNTVWDMWRTIWQENIAVIVMLTRLQEGGKKKCYQYWPEEEGVEKKYGPVTVTTSRVQCRDTFYIRTLSVKKNEETKEVIQYHYVSWPDHGAPTVTSLVSFWRHVSRRTESSSAPVLVHCSAGVGRTGAYIGLDLAMALAIGEGHIDLHDLVLRLRAERVLMMQAFAQYTFLYKALLEAYTARDTLLTVDHFDHVFPQHISSTSPQPRLDREFQTLMQLKKLTPGHSCDIARQPDNMAKNRNPRVLPDDDYLVYLTEHVPGRNQYINAVYMRTFHEAKGSILTQSPLPSTVVDFWRLVYGNDITTIVSLTSPDEEQEVEDYCVYWPREEGQTLQSGPYTLTLNKTQQHQGYSIVTHTLTLVKKGELSSRTVQLYQYRGWKGEVGGRVGEVLYLMDTLLTASPPTTSPSTAPSPPLLLQCSDGVTKSGLFSALCDIITRLTYDREVDIFMAVRHTQSVMPAAVTSLEQYRYCYEVAQSRVRDMTVYANA